MENNLDQRLVSGFNHQVLSQSQDAYHGTFEVGGRRNKIQRQKHREKFWDLYDFELVKHFRIPGM